MRLPILMPKPKHDAGVWQPAGDSLLAVLAGPEPRAAVLCRGRSGLVETLRSWDSGGRVPRWVRRASLRHPTLIVRADLAELLEPIPEGGDIGHARAALERLDLPGALSLAAGQAVAALFALVMRAAALKEIFSAADVAGIVADAVSTPAATTVADLKPGGQAVLTLESACTLITWGPSAINLRRLKGPGDPVVLETAIRQHLAPDSPTLLVGLRDDAVDAALQRAGIATGSDHRHPPGDAPLTLLESAAALALEGRLPGLTTPRQRRRATSARWATPILAATALLVAGMGVLIAKELRAARVADAAHTRADALYRSVMEQYRVTEDARQRADAILGSLGHLTTARQEADAISRFLGAVDRILLAQPDLSLTQLSVNPGNNKALLAGELAEAGASERLAAFAAALGDAGYKADPNVGLRTRAGRTHFTLQLEVPQ